mmetsp:Transcript_35693/g.114173  ORF Transcript_35693/g.114173 Transcript_35693/m.114173 type:complete len:451 (+) Transcript_35693:67-1419(+)|eukprot:CAMPEP_0118914078 /NCGR_PEP_ID=MMETSP1166-20130328/14584_1 /TAXON_ID=1104430 /ORGANISM="Chrysoreinhardia sp, Strain CCMP3193" /LENGTH=450 /DNA_ID=CAMNT_0006853645 /DNA_START=42 /DNA_END=1394 /DNA_ORIENTATION=-
MGFFPVVVRDGVAMGLFYVTFTGLYMHFEGWNVVEAVYFLNTTFTTVGYGDVAPKTKAGRLGVVLVFVLGILLVLAPLAKVVRRVSIWKRCLRHLDDLPVESHSPETVKLRARRIERWKYAVEAMPVAVVIVVVILVSFVDADTSIVDALYFAIQTCSTIGYGDLETPTRTKRRRLITSFSLLFLVVFASNLFSDLEKIADERRVRESNFREPDLEKLVIEKIHRQQRPVISEADYVLKVLEQEHLADRAVVLALKRHFHWERRRRQQPHQKRTTTDVDLQELYRQRPDAEPMTFDDWIDTYWEPKVREEKKNLLLSSKAAAAGGGVGTTTTTKKKQNTTTTPLSRTTTAKIKGRRHRAFSFFLPSVPAVGTTTRKKRTGSDTNVPLSEQGGVADDVTKPRPASPRARLLKDDVDDLDVETPRHRNNVEMVVVSRKTTEKTTRHSPLHSM